jgi:hypothetical protein
MTSEVLNHYTCHTLLTDPGPYTSALEALPEDLDALHHAINGLFVHVWKVRKFHPERLKQHAVFVRSVRRLLEGVLELNAAPLDQERLETERLIIDCRSFALVFCAVLRERGVPARLRCGFAGYLEPTHFQDHWVCEYWNGERWVMEDADVIKHDLSSGDFISGARAWSLLRSSEMDANRFGYAPEAYSRGLWAVRINLLHDVAALCGSECVSGDVWGLMQWRKGEFPAEDVAFMDEAARLASSDATLPDLQRLYSSEAALAMPDTVQHYDYVRGRGGRVRWRETL